MRRSRVHLYLVLERLDRGHRPEDIAAGLDTVELADIYGVLAFRTRHPEAVVAYLEEVDALAREVRRRLPEGSPPLALGDRLVGALEAAGVPLTGEEDPKTLAALWKEHRSS